MTDIWVRSPLFPLFFFFHWHRATTSSYSWITTILSSEGKHSQRRAIGRRGFRERKRDMIRLAKRKLCMLTYKNMYIVLPQQTGLSYHYASVCSLTWIWMKKMKSCWFFCGKKWPKDWYTSPSSKCRVLHLFPVGPPVHWPGWLNCLGSRRGALCGFSWTYEHRCVLEKH